MTQKELTRSNEIRGAGKAARETCLVGTMTESAGARNKVVRRSCEFFKKGIIALPLMLLIGGIVLEMTIAATLIIFYLLQGSIGAKNAAEALVTAQSGISDASLRLVRDRSYASAYTLAIDAQHSAQVTVCNQGHKGTGCSASGGCTNLTDPGTVEVTALGTVRGKNRCVRAIYELNGDTGEIKMESMAEVAL